MVLPKPNETNSQIALQGDAIDKKNELSRHFLDGEHHYTNIMRTVKRWEPTEQEKKLVHPLVALYFSGKNSSLVLKVTDSSENNLTKIPYNAQHRAYSIKLKEDEQIICYHPNEVELSNGYWLVVFEEKARSVDRQAKSAERFPGLQGSQHA